ncbi:hypothetical protein HUJ04_006872 [Dendroctonus ponderosae]|nr:hypothetical protein HUJ04_006872 [Dendroctonus ponderosae]
MYSGGSVSVHQDEGRLSLGSQPDLADNNDLSNLAPPDMADTIDGESGISVQITYNSIRVLI